MKMKIATRWIDHIWITIVFSESEYFFLDFLDLRVRKLKSYPMPWPKPNPSPTPQPNPIPKTSLVWLKGQGPNPKPPTKPKPIPAPHPMPAPKPGLGNDVWGLEGLLFPRNLVTENCCSLLLLLLLFQVQNESASTLVSITFWDVALLCSLAAAATCEQWMDKIIQLFGFGFQVFAFTLPNIAFNAHVPVLLVFLGKKFIFFNKYVLQKNI